MARVELVTWKDVIDHLVDWMGGDAAQSTRRDARRASLSALRDLANDSLWSYYMGRHRFVTSAVYQAGTVSYDHTGGAYERMLTLTGGTWPDWAAYGVVQISNITYEVASRVSGTVLQLTTNTNPGEDLADQEYVIYRDTYSMPTDFQAMGEVVIQNQAVSLVYEKPGDWLQRLRFYRGTATPRLYTIRGSPDFMNAMAISFFPPPDQAYPIDMVYKRQPRPLRTDQYNAGTVTVTSGSADVSGSGTAFTSAMVGSVIRLSADRNLDPTARWGSNPAAVERIVTAVSSGTALTVDDAVGDTYSSTRYVISDPVDVETTSMLTALLRGAEMQTGYARNREDYRKFETAYREALVRAREADARSFREDAAGGRRVFPARLADYPLGPDS
jgi:hypothetical protein